MQRVRQQRATAGCDRCDACAIPECAERLVPSCWAKKKQSSEGLAACKTLEKHEPFLRAEQPVYQHS